MPLDSRYEVNKPDVVDESVDGEVLIVHLGTGAYYSSRGVGDAAWQLIAAGSTALETSGLLQAAGPAVTVVPGEPVLEKYTDMQELLLLDPIHDVEEAGWPKAKPGAAAE